MIHVTVQLKNPIYTEADGTMVMMDAEPQAVDFKSDDSCQHELTICVECYPSWRNDYDVIALNLMTNEGAVILPPEIADGLLLMGDE